MRQLSYSFYREIDPICQEIFYGTEFDKIEDSTTVIINPTEELTLRSTDEKTINSFLIILSRIRSVYTNTNLTNRKIIDKATHMKELIAREY